MTKKHKSRLFTNMSSYLILQVVNLSVGIVLPRLYLGIYGSEVNGVISTVNSFISYFSYVEAGLGASLIHALYKPLSRNDSVEINGVLSYSKEQYKKISHIYLALVVLLSAIFPLTRPANNLTPGEFASLVFVIGFYGAFDFYTMAKFRVLLTADKKEYIISYAMIVAQVLRFVLTWILLQFDISVVFVKIVPIFTLFVRSVILKAYINKTYPTVTFQTTEKPDVSTAKKRWDALLLQLSINTSTALPVLIVSNILGYKEANVYAIYSLVVSAVIALVSALSSGVAPVFGEKIALNQSVHNIYHVYGWGVSFVLTLVFSVCGVMILPFVKLYVAVVDDVNYIYASYAVLFSLWGALHSFRIPFTAVINAAALYKETRALNITNLALQIILGVVLACLWGINGVLVALIISALHRNISMAFVIDRKLTPHSFKRTMLLQTVMFLMIAVSFQVGSLFVDLEQVTIFSWIFTTAASVILLFVVCVAVYALLDIKTTKVIFHNIRRKLSRR